MNMIEKRLMKYIPKKIQPHVIHLYEQCPRTSDSPAVYALGIDVDGEYVAGVCDGVKEIRWAANYMMENKEYNF